MKHIRIHIIFVFFCLCSLTLICRLYHLQVIKHSELNSMAIVREKIAFETSVPRGGIYDRSGKEMALSIQAPSAYLITGRSEDPKGTLRALSCFHWVDMKNIKEAFQKDKGFVWIKRKLNPFQKDSLTRLNLKEIDFVMEPERYYPNSDLAAQVLGFVGTDGTGLEGLEYFFNKILDTSTDVYPRDFSYANLDPYCFYERLAPYYFYETKECDLFLTIDLVMQYLAEDALRKACKKVEARHGVLIIMDTYTGEIHSLANWPGYNPNHFFDYPKHFWRNRCVTDIYEPGSIFKIFWAAALIEEEMIQTDSLIYCEKGSMKVADKRIRDHKKFGWLSFKQVLEKSSNIGAIKCAEKLGKTRYYQYIKAFGFGEKTGIDFPGESRGILRSPEDWSGLSLASMAIGQEISVTPIQMITAFSALVNGGRLMMPFILKEVRNANGNLLFEQTPKLKRQVVNASTSQQIKEILHSVVSRGTGVNADVPGYWIGGKTGTAQMLDKATGEYSHDDFLTSFIGFFPDSTARWAMLVMVYQPRAAACWGGEVAAPIFSEVAEKVINYMHIPPVEKDLPVRRHLTITAGL